MARMNFTNTTPERTNPPWAMDGRGAQTLVPAGAKVLASAFPRLDRVVVTVGANAAQNATSITVAALSGPIPTGSLLYFGGTKIAQLTATAAAGATVLTVVALPTALVTNDVATYAGVGRIEIASGTLIGRTYAERDAGTGFGPADTVTPDDEIYLLAFEIADAEQNNDAELYRHGRVVKETNLPNWSTLSAGAKAVIRARYQCISGE